MEYDASSVDGLKGRELGQNASALGLNRKATPVGTARRNEPQIPRLRCAALDDNVVEERFGGEALRGKRLESNAEN
jgi:hypothetical protein